MPADLRDGSVKVPPADDAEGLAALVSRQVADLRGRQEDYLDESDEAERGMAAWGMPLEEDPFTARLRKYERGCRGDLNRALAELRKVREEATPAGSPARPEPELSHRRPVSAAAADYLAKRSQSVALPPREAAAEAKAPAVAEAPALVAAKAPAPAPAAVATAARSSLVATEAPRNRRERRAAEKRARQAARRDGR